MTNYMWVSLVFVVLNKYINIDIYVYIHLYKYIYSCITYKAIPRDQRYSNYASGCNKFRSSNKRVLIMLINIYIYICICYTCCNVYIIVKLSEISFAEGIYKGGERSRRNNL